MTIQRLWSTVPIFSRNLIKCGIITSSTNEKISQDSVATFENYCSSKNHATGIETSQSLPSTRSRRTRNRRARESSPQTSNLELCRDEQGKGLTINDYFFEHQRVNGYINGTPILSQSQDVHALSNIISLQVEKYLETFGGGASELTQLMHSGIISLDMWVAIQQGNGAYHKDHVHEGVLLSGVYYSSIPEGSSPLVFHKPKIHSDEDGNEEIETNEVHILEPEEGQIVVFPPWLLHGVPPTEKQNKPRISLAFNLSGAYTDPWSVTKI
mmetsp:Transcript_9628/g.14491  ORF Transcript_9628/g.14491 Transcript_9628/m.14491 type:complete len:269 (-) Transcript_9628:1501-2307(-)